MRYILPLILAIAATAQGLPTANQTTSNLEKRDHHGWIGSFSDPQCKGPETGPRPELHLDGSKKCRAFSPAKETGYFGIYFGSGLYSYDFLTMFSDTSCKTLVEAAGSTLWKEDYTSTDFACVSVGDYDWQFGSVEANSN